MGIEAGAALLISAVIGAGASVYAASQQETPEAPKAPRIEKAVQQDKDKLKELEEADPGMSKRKKASSKDKFKVGLQDATTGVTTDAGAVEGVQI